MQPLVPAKQWRSQYDSHACLQLMLEATRAAGWML